MALAALLALASGCTDGSGDKSLSFGEGAELARAPDGYDAVALVRHGDGALALWSERGGLYARRLDPEGAPRGSTRRLFVRCDHGLDAIAGETGPIVACLIAPQLAADKAGELVVLWLGEDLSVRDRTALRPAGRDSRGVALAIDGEAVRVVWHDGTPGRWRVWSARVRPGEQPDPRAQSSEGVAAGVPSLLRHEDRTLLAWGETWTGGGTLVTHDGSGAPRRFEQLSWPRPSPRLARDDRGPVLAFRDTRPADTRANLLMGRLDPSSLKLAGDPERVARADGDAPPTLVRCLDRTMTIAPRTWGQTLVVGINGVDKDFEVTYGEHQVYEYGVDFRLADGVCVDDRLIIVAAGTVRAQSPRARLDVNVLARR